MKTIIAFAILCGTLLLSGPATPCADEINAGCCTLPSGDICCPPPSDAGTKC